MKKPTQLLKYYVETLELECNQTRFLEDKHTCECIIAKLRYILEQGIRPDTARISAYIDTLKAKANSALTSSEWQAYTEARNKLKQIRKLVRKHK
jgi:hypothetical protein